MDTGIMLIGSKETFLIKALEKKIESAGLSWFFVPFEIDAVNRSLDRAGLITFYFDNTEHIRADVLHFVSEHISGSGVQVILIGERVDTDKARSYLPAHKVVATFARPLDTDAYLSEARHYLSGGDASSGKKSILIVDDDPTYMGVIRDWMRGIYNVAMVTSGMQAITYLSMNHVDLILLDFEMPVTPGPQVLEMLRSEPSTAGIPVIFLTGHNDRESVMKVVALKPEGYLLKTIQRGDLLKELKLFFTEKET